MITCYSKIVPDCLKCQETREKIELEYNGKIPNVFFDWIASEASHCTLIDVNGRFAGLYCKRINHLALTNWTHDTACIRVAQKLIPELIRKLNLKEISDDIDLLKREIDNIKITIGGDPEFEELSELRYTPMSTRYRGVGVIGCDDSGNQLELRPKPANSPEELVENIRKLIHLVDAPISVKGDRYPLGGHIHFSYSSQIFILSDEKLAEIVSELLDHFLGKKLIELSGKARGTYKELGSFRLKPHGFEYRTLPSAYLIEPEIARIVFKIAKNLVEYFIRNQEIVANDPPTLANYMEFASLTEKEYDYFMGFIENYKFYDGTAINENWGKKLRLKTFIDFRDEWDISVREMFNQELEKEELVRTITLYGLKKSRGNVVAGFSLSGYERIEHPSESYEGCFGIPYGIRMNPNIDIETVKQVVLAIRKEINNVHNSL